MNTLPPLNPIKARSSIAVFLAILALFAPDLAAKLDPDTLLGAMAAFLDAYDRAVIVGGIVWAWIERKNPGRSLSFRASLRA